MLAQVYHQITPTPSPVLARALITHHARDPRTGLREYLMVKKITSVLAYLSRRPIVLNVRLISRRLYLMTRYVQDTSWNGMIFPTLPV